jgi:hypothetical protein
MQLVAKENKAPICLVLHTYKAIFQGKYFGASLNIDICDMNFMFFLLELCFNKLYSIHFEILVTSFQLSV